MASTDKPGPSRTLYQSIAQRLMCQIRDGTLPAGARLPSVREIAERFGVSNNTAVQAYRHLESFGVVDVRPRSGYFVRDVAPGGETSATPGYDTPRSVSWSEHVLRLMEPHARRDMVRMGIGLPAASLMPLRQFHRVLADTARKFPEESWDYMHPDGHLPLRRQIARRTLTCEFPASVDDVLITNGCMEALSLALQAVSRPGDAIAVEAPVYYGTLLLLGTHDRRVLEIPTSESEGLDLAALERAMANRSIRACMFSANAQNPLGFTMPEANKRELVRLAARYDIPVIENDVWGSTVADPDVRLPAKASDGHGIVIYCSSFSKVLMPGLRVGWALPGRYARKFRELKRFTTIVSPSLAQVALAQWLQRGLHDEHMDMLRRELARQVEETARLVLRRFPPGTAVNSPSGGCVLWIRLPPGVDSRRLASDAKQSGIHVFPGEVFAPDGRFRDRLRINAGNPLSPRIRRAVATLGALAARQHTA